LARLLERSREREERLAPELVAWIGARAADALDHAHSLAGDSGNALPVVHGDVSPANVFLTYDGRVVLIDRGSAKTAVRAPDHRADLFALGATLYEAAVGKSPLSATAGGVPGAPEGDAVPPPSSLLPGFPEELSGILLRALERDPELCSPSAAALSHDLDHFAGQNASASSLAELLSVYFEEERAAHDAAVAELRAEAGPVRGLPPGLTTTEGPTAASVRAAHHEKPSRWGLVALACALPMVVVALFAVRSSIEDGDEPGAAARTAPAGAAVPADPPASAGNNAAPAVSAIPRADGGATRFVP
jgi:serine/threonine-protein kinase